LAPAMAVTRSDPVVDAAPADLVARTASAAALLAGRDVRRAAKLLSRAVIAEWPAWSKPENIVDSAGTFKFKINFAPPMCVHVLACCYNHLECVCALHVRSACVLCTHTSTHITHACLMITCYSSPIQSTLRCIDAVLRGIASSVLCIYLLVFFHALSQTKAQGTRT
jgi:hypothetical protein